MSSQEFLEKKCAKLSAIPESRETSQAGKLEGSPSGRDQLLQLRGEVTSRKHIRRDKYNDTNTHIYIYMYIINIFSVHETVYIF